MASLTIRAAKQRSRALSLYRQIRRHGKEWDGPDMEITKRDKERAYIKNELQRLYRRNIDIIDPEVIDAKLFEAETRMELAMHYKIPYPRSCYVTGVTADTLANKHLTSFCDAAYMHSYYHDENEGKSMPKGFVKKTVRSQEKTRGREAADEGMF
mmetsp:Transcript_290/g.303  ORF Transcript_290/g.303 Transcript_290/m.303 type:complete len:155 (-) Transcript_290:141-605(-)